MLSPDGQLTPPRQPATPRSEVYLVESPEDVKLSLEAGLELGKHKFSGLTIPLKLYALKYHVGVVGATGTGKSKLVVALIKEVLEKTGWRVIVFDHSGQDYAMIKEFEDKVINGDEVVQDLETIADYLEQEISAKDTVEDALYVSLLLYTLFNDEFRVTQQKLVPTSSPGTISIDEAKLKKKIDQIPEILETVDLEEKLKNVQWKVSAFISLFDKVLEIMTPRASRERFKALLSLQKTFLESLNKRRITSREILKKLDGERLVVIDLSPVRQEERKHLVASVLRRIWSLIDEKKQPVNTLVVIDEAHNYVCHQGCSPSSGLIERTAREGRKWGFGLVLASQRIIDFATDVRNNINTFFFSKLQTPGDLGNLAGVLDLGGIEYDDIAILATREFYFAGLGNPLKYPVLIEVKQV